MSDINTKAAVPTKHIVGLNNFLPNKHRVTPIAIRMAPQSPTYLFKKVQIALIDTT
jgi:hypothetical protein